MVFDFFLKRIESQYKNQLPFVVYRKPNKFEVKALLQENDALYFTTDFKEKGFVFSPFDNLNKTVLMPLDVLAVISSTPECYFDSVEKGLSFCNTILSDSPKEKQDHINLLKKGIEAIQKSDLEKVVLSRVKPAGSTNESPISLFKRLLQKYTSAFVYCWYHPKVGLWLGATPETLIKVEDNKFSIMALAGTQKYEGTLDVVWKDKEKQEQKIVTDFIADNLKDSVENLKISETKTTKAGDLLHLKTMIFAKLKKGTNLKNLIFMLHPTPAVCGFPKKEAKEFILANENYNREFYTGYLGELNLETSVAPRSSRRNVENRAYAFKKVSTQLYVNLRCMQLKGNEVLVYAGGGITKHSNIESEWEETVSKTLIIKSIL